MKKHEKDAKISKENRNFFVNDYKFVQKKCTNYFPNKKENDSHFRLENSYQFTKTLS